MCLIKTRVKVPMTDHQRILRVMKSLKSRTSGKRKRLLKPVNEVKVGLRIPIRADLVSFQGQDQNRRVKKA